MIKELALLNWKSFADAKLYIDPITFMIGTNAAGKSNALDALSFLQRSVGNMALSQAIGGSTAVPPLRGGKEWSFRSGSDFFSISVTIEDNPAPSNGEQFVYTLSLRKTKDAEGCELLSERLDRYRDEKLNKTLFYTDKEEPGKAIIPVYFYTGKRGGAKRVDMNRAYSILSQLITLSSTKFVTKEVFDGAKVVAGALSRIFILDPIPSNMRGYAALSDTLNHDASNIAGVLAAIPDDRRSEVERQLSEYVAPLPEKDIRRVWTAKIGQYGTDAMLYCEEGWKGSGDTYISADARGMSDGTLRFVAVVAALLTLAPYSLLVIEEIDNGLHPSRVKELIDMLVKLGRERHIDILCTTHNPTLLDELGPEMIQFISYVHRDKDTGAGCITLLEDKENLVKLLGTASLGKLMSLDKI
ncbi:MAG: AAA family ATPase [Muribaculaceae bacterium]|nr:AAA family ATPase [Muribaculaceae bacterium]MDE6509541.1 AAA family ATPase [Muribaculaceae bacterium]